MTLNYQIIESDELKKLVSEDYNYVYNRYANTILRWGKNIHDNPVWNPYGPESATIDVKDMSMELYTVVIDILTSSRTLTTVNLLNLVDEENWKAFYLYGVSKGIVVTNFPFETYEDAGFFSLYVNNEGIVSPVSIYDVGIDILSVNNLYLDVWQSSLFKTYRWKEMEKRVNEQWE